MTTVTMFGETSVGMVRKNNQDSIFYDERAQAGVVADGIGGRKGGDVAFWYCHSGICSFYSGTQSTHEGGAGA